jgi:5'-3' exoribonuclease 1
MERNTENKRKICTNYLEAIEWVFFYYSGNCPDWRWSYEYHYPPLLTDLYNHIPDFDTKFIKQNRKPFPANVQLAYVLPPSQYDLLSENMRLYIRNKHAELLNATVEFQWAFCRYFWEAHLKSSHVNLSVLEKWEKDNICVE